MADNNQINEEEPLIDTFDVIILLAAGICGLLYFFREKLFTKQTEVPAPPPLTTLNRGLVKKKNKDFVQKMRDQDKNVILFYGSQTGTAEDYASRLAKEGAQRFGLRTLAVDVEDCDMALLDKFPKDCMAFFLMATYGEGEPTDDAVDFWELLNSELPEFSQGDAPEDKPLSNLRYVVFALGNKTYEHFNAVGRYIDKKLEELGANRVYVKGEGDDDGSLEEDFLGWKEDMWKAVCEAMNVDLNAVQPGARIPTYTIEELGEYDQTNVFYGEFNEKALSVNGMQNPYPSFIQRTRELFNATDRNCVHVELDITGSGLTYQSGDHVAIWPMNSEQDVYRLLKVLGLWEKRDKVVMVSSSDSSASKKHPFPVPTTYATIFRNYLDIHAPASRQFIATLANYIPTQEGRARLTTLGEDKEAYKTQVADAHLTLGELLESVAQSGKTLEEIPLDLIIETLPRLQCRYYSISSTPKVSPTSIHITATILSYHPSAAPTKTVYGLATNYLLQVHRKLENIEHPETAPYYLYSGPRNKFHDEKTNTIKLALHVRHTNFKLPRNLETPVIMVGPGTGIAPFRGFILERAKFKSEGESVGDTVLFYGCRKENEDFLYKDELRQAFAQLGDSGKLFTAFSREQEHKVYVQHRLMENADYIWKLLYDHGAFFYVCGDAKNMAHDVNDSLVRIAQKHGSMDEARATAYVKDLRNQGKYQEDVWS
ncbi:5895_t:CDS:2 [Ambispora gerdemannii]|uniref:NADPH--cytochrome P450 reductase n=1 Tax=Ambispora gerdemannii TaxID=144530 RepID=A0A9N8W350_9GLOM|nr:5895_t:CDS:2 [Ambispora gerdemannii]